MEYRQADNHRLVCNHTLGSFGFAANLSPVDDILLIIYTLF